MEDIDFSHYDIGILHIDSSEWFTNLEYYPKTIEQMLLFISIIDKIGITSKYDILLTYDMSCNKLDVLYAVLRIMNKIFNKYLDFVVRKIFRRNFKRAFACSDLRYHGIFMDQLTQDIDNFVCSTLKQYQLEMDVDVIAFQTIEYLKQIFSKTFYESTLRKLSYRLDDNFYEHNYSLFFNTVKEFINYTEETLSETYDTMKIFLDAIFSYNCTDEMVAEIKTSLGKYIDLKSLFKEKCMELDIYSEQKLDDESENEEYCKPKSKEKKLVYIV